MSEGELSSPRAPRYSWWVQYGLICFIVQIGFVEGVLGSGRMKGYESVTWRFGVDFARILGAPLAESDGAPLPIIYEILLQLINPAYYAGAFGAINFGPALRLSYRAIGAPLLLLLLAWVFVLGVAWPLYPLLIGLTSSMVPQLLIGYGAGMFFLRWRFT